MAAEVWGVNRISEGSAFRGGYSLSNPLFFGEGREKENHFGGPISTGSEAEGHRGREKETESGPGSTEVASKISSITAFSKGREERKEAFVASSKEIDALRRSRCREGDLL